MSNSEVQLAGANFESHVAESVRSYFRAAHGGDATEEQKALRSVCSGLEGLLGQLLQGNEGWTGWIDGIFPAYDTFPDALKVISPVELTLRGSALWGQASRGPFWIEPFLASIRICENRDSPLSYSLQFGDAAQGLGTVAYAKHIRRPNWFFPVEWLFTFSKAPIEDPQLGDRE